MSEAGIFQRCQDEFPGADQGVLVQCVSNLLEQNADLRAADLKSFLFVLAGAMVFFMQAGFAMLCAGAVRLKNVQNTMLKNLLDACGAAVAFYLIGYASFANIDDPAFWFFQYAFSATSVTIVAGTLAERCQMAAYLCYSVVLAGFIYPVVAHSVWRYVQSIMVAYDLLA
jgi:ammonia channel protein AmtB